MKELPSFEKPLFIYDDRSKGCYGYVTDIIFKDDQCLLIDFKFFEFDEDEDDKSNLVTENLHIDNEKFRAMVYLDNLNVYSNEVYDSYRLSNFKEHLSEALKDPVFLPPVCHFKQ